MTPAAPDPHEPVRPYLAARVRAHRLAQAARSNPAPVVLSQGHFAPPNVHAVWHLVTPAHNVLRLVWREDTDDFRLAILSADGGAA